MKLELGKFYGTTKKKAELSYFNLTLTEYSPYCKIDKHNHQTPYLSLLINGNYKEISKGREQTVLQGNTVFRPSDYEHQNEFDNSLGKCFNVEIKIEAFPFFSTLLEQSKAVFINQSSIDIYFLLQNFFSGTNNNLNNLCFELVSEFVKGNEYKNYGRALWIKEIMNLIQDKPANDFNVEEIARAMNIHPVYLVRKFKEKTGLKLTQYITKVRLTYALHKMNSGNHNLTEVCYDCGFYDQSHFNRIFKLSFGISPGKFLKIIKG